MRHPGMQYIARLEELSRKVATANCEVIDYNYEIKRLENDLVVKKALREGAARKLSGLVGLMHRLMRAPSLDSWGLPSFGNKPGVITKKEWEEQIKVLGND